MLKLNKIVNLGKESNIKMSIIFKKQSEKQQRHEQLFYDYKFRKCSIILIIKT